MPTPLRGEEAVIYITSCTELLPLVRCYGGTFSDGGAFQKVATLLLTPVHELRECKIPGIQLKKFPKCHSVLRSHRGYMVRAS